METENKSAYSTETFDKPAGVPEDSGTEEDMAPQENDSQMMNRQNGSMNEHHQMSAPFMGRESRRSKFSEPQRLTSDEGENAEDGEILEDGEIASDEGEANDDGEVPEEDSKSQSSSPSKKSHKDDRERHGRNKRDRHSKRRRSKEDGHRDKQQKKKRHREYVDYDKAGDADQSWSPEKRDKGDRKGERSPPAPYHSPSHDSHGEERGKNDKEGDKHRRGSGDNRHHGSGRDRERTRDKDRNRDSRERSRDRHEKDKKDKHDRSDKDKKERDRHKDTRDKEGGKPYQHSDGYESPPGLYDSPSDEEYGDNRFGVKTPKTMMSMVEGDYMDPALAVGNDNEAVRPKSKKKMLKKKEWQERVRQREREREFDEDQPVKKKPLLQTPMEERPVCKFFLEGKCQKGVNCLFKHDYKELPKRLELCRYYLKSFCRQEDECPFMHSEFPCKYFHTGSTCYQGDNCKFSHDPLTPETEEALRNALNDNEVDEHFEGFEGGRKHKKKGLLGDQPQLSEEEIHRKLEEIKRIPSIFDIETFAPGESPSKPPRPPHPPQTGQSPSGIRPQGFYQDANMSPQSGSNMRFNGPPNQGPPPQRPFMQGPGGPRMDGPPPGMQGPMGGQSLMGQGPPPMGPQGPGMQGAPMGPPMNNPPMSQAAALVGALLRAAPMLQGFRGPGQQGPPTSMANSMNSEPMFMGQQGGMGPNPNMMTGPPPNMTQGPPPPISSPGQDSMMNQGPLMPGNQGQEGFGPDGMQQQQNLNPAGMPANTRDPRRNMGAQNDPRRNRDLDSQKQQDVDMRGAGPESMEDVDLRQDIDMRQEDTSSKINQGNTTPQQDWDDDLENKIDDSDIPSHLPPKQREMFLRIKQHTMKMNAQKVEGQKLEQRETTPVPKADDDKWYSSDEDDETKPDISNILKNLNQNEIKKEPGLDNTPVSIPSSINVMQMINAIKSSTHSDTMTFSSTRQMDPRIKMERPPEPAMIVSQEGDSPWRLCKVSYTKQKIPLNLELSDPKYKNDPRVQKILKLQELESGVIIDHSKISVPIKPENSQLGEQRPKLLDPKILQKPPPPIPRPELPPFVDPRLGKSENVDPRVKQEPQAPRPQDPRIKPGMDIKPSDPRVPKVATHNLPVKPMDPRLSRQDSNSAMSSMGRMSDPRLSRQNSREPEMNRSSTPPMDPRQLSRQSSGDPRLQRTDTTPINSVNMSKPLDPRLGRVIDSDIGPPSVQRQMSQPNTLAEKDAASSNPQKPKLDYRNDPRFKRKHISESNLPPEALVKRYTGQRKSSTEYSSPLGDEGGKQEESGYNSYNRPRPPVKSQNTAFSESDTVVNPEITTHDILDSIQIMPPPTLETVPRPDKNLKDIFKTIDPTASPFC